MGCYNGTCAISRLPIIVPDDVYAQFIVKSNDESYGSNSYCYDIGLYAPISLPIQAQYNDYGSIEHIKEDFVYKFLKRTFGITDVNVWLDLMHDNCVTVTDYQKKKYTVGLWMVRKDIVDQFFATDYKIRSYSLESSKLETKNYQDILDYDALSFYEDLIEKKDKIAELFSNDKSSFFARYVLEARSRKNDNLIDYYLGKSGWAGASFLTNDSFEDYRKYIYYLIHKGFSFESDEVQEFMNSVKAYCKIKMILAECRIGYCPQTGAGSQHQELQGYKRLNSSMNKVMNQISKDRYR